LAKVTHVVRKEDALDLPKQTHEVRRVTLGPAECKAYNALKEDLVLRFSDETILATHALVEIMKLRQITSGFVYGETGTHQVGKSKLNELKDLLEEIGDKQVIIWCNFKEEMNAVYETLKDSRGLPMASVLTGDNRQEVIDAFKSGWSKYLIANPQSAGHGLTFVNCSYAIYFGLNYSYELLKQSQDRIHRIGQKVPCTYYYLLADRSIDEVIYKSLLHKSEMSTEVLNYLKEHSHGRRPQIQTT
jgi:SNF2 family DNA or RNA helicase